MVITIPIYVIRHVNNASVVTSAHKSYLPIAVSNSYGRLNLIKLNTIVHQRNVTPTCNMVSNIIKYTKSATTIHSDG